MKKLTRLYFLITMGVYYHFFNISKANDQNKFVLSGRLCDFITKFDKYSLKDKKEIFQRCLILNNWDEDDVILAVPDYYDHDVIKYKNGKICIDNNYKDNYFTND